ncbi:SDR family NAD(P)-dependent oxidoreductase [Nitrolancea hollandica]|uniref:Putative Genome sequencing data, contig C313 n=1 Tax=Nitrolancea hollandica Lb TaxID=1129897 RepID=I4EFA2_9BACT|nr:SDR family oxidoreductase [Nitrolancea hollandica]CCF83364.1 putative Genome sequencing data, contig C313 [Nitrolancea hollandica Lb]
MQYQARSALVTGASSGIGEAFARGLAARGMNLLLTALPEDESLLRAIAMELSEQHGVRTEAVAIDLAEHDAGRRLQAAGDALGFEPDLLVNNAGIGTRGVFAELPLDLQLDMIRVNIEALVALTGLYVPRMVARRDGAVINVASTAAFAPIPYFAVYAASKAFVQRFGEALWAENHRHGVRITTVCPGPVFTRFQGRFGTKAPASRYALFFWRILHVILPRPLTVEMIVADTLQALEQDQPTVVRRVPGAGPVYHSIALAMNALPQRLRLLAIERINR